MRSFFVDGLRKAFSGGVDNEKAYWLRYGGYINGFEYNDRNITFDEWLKKKLSSSNLFG